MSAIPLSETAAKRRIGDILLAHGFVTPDELAEAALEQERTQQPLGQILVGRGAITRLELASALAEQWSDPAASIPSTPRSGPRPAPLPSAQDEAQYAARLQEAVADLARKVQSDKPLEGIDERVDELSRRIEGTLARTQHIEAAVATLAESLEGVTTGVEEAFYALQVGTADLVGDLARIEQTVGEIAARDVPPGDAPSLADLEELRAAVADLSGETAGATELKEQVVALAARLDSLAEPESAMEDMALRVEQVAAQLEDLRSRPHLDELQSTVHDLEQRSSSFVDLAERIERIEKDSAGDHLRAERLHALEVRLDALAGEGEATRRISAQLHALEELLADGVVTPASLAHALESHSSDDLLRKFDVLEARLADGIVTPDALTHSIEWAMRDAPAVEQRVTELAAEVAALRAEIASGPGQDDRPDETDRLDEIEARIELLSHDPREDHILARRLDELEQAHVGDLDTINVLAVAMDRIRHDLTTRRPTAEAEAPDVLEAVTALGERIAALESAPVAATASSDDDSELVSELERVRMLLERVGLHLGEHDRAIADLVPSSGIEERLQELTVLVHDLARSQQAAAIPQPSSAAAPISGDIGSLLQRVEEAETASQTDSEKLMNRLERMASSIDWRLQRLESDPADEAE